MDTSVRQQTEPVCITWSKTGDIWDLGQKWGNQLQWSLTPFLRWRGFFLNSILFSDQCCWEAMLPGVFEEFWSLIRNEMTQINQIYHVSYPLTENKTELTKSPQGVLLIEALSQTWRSTLNWSSDCAVRLDLANTESFCGDQKVKLVHSWAKSHKIDGKQTRTWGEIWALSNFKSQISDVPQIFGGCGEHFMTVWGLKLKKDLNERWTVG